MKYPLSGLYKLIVLGAGVVAMLCIATTPARAHANLADSSPANGERLAKPPEAILLNYTEEIDPAFTKVEVRNSQGDVVVNEAGTLTTQERTALFVQLPPLPEDSYSALWRVRSLVDGHISVGAVTFAVGNNTPLPSRLPPPGAPMPTSALPEIAEVILRWLNYLALALLIGPIFFVLFVWRSAYWFAQVDDRISDEAVERIEQIDDTVSRGLRRLVLYGSIGLAGLTLLFVGYQAWQLAIITDDGTFLQALMAFLSGKKLLLLAARFVALLCIWVNIPHLTGTAQSAWSWRMAAGMGFGICFTFSLQGHTAAFNSWLMLFLNSAHLLAMSIWLGGLVVFVFVYRWRKELPLLFWHRLVQRFSALALLSVGVLALTGLYNGLELVGAPEQLLATTYGRALAVKLFFFTLLLLFGALNLFVLSPGLLHSTVRLGWLNRTVRVEILYGVLALGAAAVMTAIAPAADALLAQKRLGVIETQNQNAVQFTTWVLPARAGDNEFAVDVVDQRPGIDEQKNPLQVLLRLTHITMEMGVQELQLVAQSPGRYVLRGSYVPMEGRWNAEVILRRTGFDDVRYMVELDTLDRVFP